MYGIVLDGDLVWYLSRTNGGIAFGTDQLDHALPATFDSVTDAVKVIRDWQRTWPEVDTPIDVVEVTETVAFSTRVV